MPYDFPLRAFASTGIVETQWAIVKKLTSPLELSVQEFVSCSGNAGCNGGSIEKTLHWLANATYYEKVTNNNAVYAVQYFSISQEQLSIFIKKIRINNMLSRHYGVSHNKN